MLEDEDECVTLYWFWPQLDGNRPADWWSPHRAVAKSLGFAFEMVSPSDVAVAIDSDGRAKVRIGDRLITPRNSIIGNKVYTWPAFEKSVWRSFALFERLRSLGFHLLHSAGMNIVGNDKAATSSAFGGLAAPAVPSLAIESGSMGGITEDLLAWAGIAAPYVVKPASWAGGMGVIRAETLSDLRMAIRLASASEMSVVVQPCLPDIAADVRVFCLEGVSRAAYVRSMSPDGTVATRRGGGEGVVAEVPAPLVDRAAAVAKQVGSPWLAVDFLRSGDEYVFSEIEIEPYMGPDYVPEEFDLLRQRFALVLDEHEAMFRGVAASGGRLAGAPGIEPHERR